MVFRDNEHGMIGKRIKQLRISKKLTQQQLADKIASSSGYISEMESGKAIPGGTRLLSLKRFFGVSIDWLLTGEGEKYLSNEHKDASIDVLSLEQSDESRPFKNKTLAIEINRILKEIEDIDETHLREIKGLLRAELSQLRTRPDHRSGVDRRKEDIPELTPEDDRRSGNERRVAGLNS